MELKNKPTEEETSTTGKTPLNVYQYKAFHARLPEILVEDLIGLLNHGSLFANHCRLVLDVDGPHSVRIRHTIMDDAVFDDSETFDRLISGAFASDTDSKYLDLSFGDLTDTLRTAIGSTIVAYLTVQNS